MQTRSYLPGSIEARDAGRLGVGIHPYPTHHIVTGWANFHGLLGDIQVSKLLELMVHARELALDGFRIALVGDIQKHAAVRTPPTGQRLSPDSARHHVARQQVWRPSCVPVAFQPAFGFLWGVSRLGGEHLRNI